MKVFGAIFVGCALLIAGVAQLNNCEHDGLHMTLANGMQAPMRCYWTAQAELVTGGSLLLVGGMLALSKRRETQRDLGIVGVALGAFTMLLPTALIGVCTNMTASCNLIMRPAMLFLGTIVIAVSLATLVGSARRQEPAV